MDDILAVTDEADVFVDVGANIGYYSCLLRQQNALVAPEGVERWTPAGRSDAGIANYLCTSGPGVLTGKD